VRRSGPLADRRVAALLVAEVVSTTGSQMTWLALPWFVLVTTGSAARMSFVIAAEIAGMALFSLPGGSLLERLGARRLMLLADSCRAPLLLLVPVLQWSGLLTYPLLLALVFATGAFFGPYFAAQRVIVPELLGEAPDVVARANALLQGATRITLLLGPALAGVLISAIGASSVIVIDAATYAFSALTVLLFVPAMAPVEHDESARGLLAGLRYFARDPLLRAWGSAFVVIDASWTVLFAGIPVLVFEEYGAHAATAGWIIAAFGAGAVLGNTVAYKIADRFDSMTWVSCLLLVEALPLWVLVFPVPAVVAGLAVGTAGVLNGLVNPSMHSILTLRPPAAVRAKVMTATLTLSSAGGPLALIVAAPAFGAVGPRPVFAAVAAAQTVVRGIAGTVGLRLRAAGAQPAPA
jgi:MFS family permease